MSAGEAVGTTVFDMGAEALGVTINEMFGQTEMNYIVGNSQRARGRRSRDRWAGPTRAIASRVDRRRRQRSARAANPARSR